MKPFDNRDERAPKSVPDMIRTLWSLYMDMSLDPAMAVAASHVRSAALELEDARRVALEVSQEEGCRAPAACGGKSKKARSSARRGGKSRRKDKAAAEWLRNVPPASPWKQ